MNKKIFLTSAVIMCMACPAIAETFPQDGNMLENKTYDNAATYANTGIYEGDVTADAEYSLNPYSVSAGSYFTGIDNSTNQATTAQCTSGNYCPGVASTTFDNNAFGDTGLQTCPSGYASSDLGASANTQCYRTCDIANMGANGTIAAIAHAATLSGNDYYGNGTDTCEPATCVSGWHVKESLNLATEIDTTAGVNSAYVNNSGTFGETDVNFSSGNNGAAYYGLSTSNHNTWAVEYDDKGMVVGQGRCSTTPGTANSNGANTTFSTETSLTDETGETGARYCYCNVTGYTPAGGTLQSLSSSWVFRRDSGDASGCASSCAFDCAGDMRGADTRSLAFRATLLGTVQSGPASCEANTINITWNDASAEDIAATGAATTVYEGDIKTPLKAVTKPGKTFVGWKFVKPAQQTPVEPEQGEGD